MLVRFNGTVNTGAYGMYNRRLVRESQDEKQTIEAPKKRNRIVIVTYIQKKKVEKDVVSKTNKASVPLYCSNKVLKYVFNII